MQRLLWSSDERDDWKVRVKVFLTWKQTYIKNPSTVISMDTILMDEQGNKIIASMKKFLIPEFEDTLKEGNFVDLTEFGVESYKGDYMLIDHNWKINLLGCSKVRRCPSFEPATNGYNVENFDDVLSWNVSNIFGFDVVGELISINPMRIKKENGIESKKIEFKLQDIAGKKIDCNIWGEHAMKLHQYMAKNKGISDRVVIMIQNAKIKEWPKGSRIPQVSNHLFGARIHINSEASPIVSFKTDLLDRDDQDISATQVTQLADITEDTIIECLLDYYLVPPYKSVEQVRSTMKVSTCVIKTTVSKILLDEGWFTYSCDVCNMKATSRSVDTSSERVYDCKKCGPVKKVSGNVRIVMRVHDATGSTSIILFDNQLSKLINRSISWLNRKVENINDPHTLPHELHGLVNKELVCKIQVGSINLTKGYTAYTVHCATFDDEILTAFEDKQYDVDEESDFEKPFESTPISKVCTDDEEDIISPDSAQEIDPSTVNLKRKSTAPFNKKINDTVTTSTSKETTSTKNARRKKA